ncbi:MAG TPA: AAA family ATPase [Vitreimonas sp.]|nr:AAA family ATPase [Vitreimonas sp.]
MSLVTPTPLYRNITIAGLPGSGSTTLLKGLKEELQFQGWKGFSGGEFMRTYAAEKGLYDASQNLHHDATVYTDDFDRQVDLGMREKLETEESWILEAWLSGFMAQNVPGVLKVLMICSDDAVRIDRIVNRDVIDVDEAKKHIHERKEKNLAKWSRMYGDLWQEWVVKPGKVSASDPIDFWRPDLYDLVIDTFSTNKQETLQLVVDAIKKTS